MGKPRSGIQVSIYNTPGNEQCGPTSCARVITRDTKRMNDICEYISECSSVTSADIKGVLEALTSSYRQGIILWVQRGTGRIGTFLAIGKKQRSNGPERKY